MKKTIFTVLSVLMIMSISAGSVSAQIQWTPEQKAILATENTINDLAVKGDVEGILSYYDDDFQNWAPNSHIPISKSILRQILEYHVNGGGKIAFHTMVPVNIWVNGNYAYIDYYDSWIYENKDGKKSDPQRGRNLDVLLKKGNKWVVVASMTQADPNDK